MDKMDKINRWCYYNVNQPFKKIYFNDQMKLTIDQAFSEFKSKKLNGVTICGAVFDFASMECKCGDMKFKLSPNGGCMPYKVVLGGDPEGLSKGDREALSKLDKTKVAHKWLWWDNPTGADPFGLYEKYAEKRPTWTHYSPADEKKLEELYQLDPNKKKLQPINKLFCIVFSCTYNEKYTVKIQGRIDDEKNNTIPDNQKRRRPVIRARYCWCWDNSDGTGAPVWTPYELEVSEALEENYIVGMPEVDITLGGSKYTVNFTQRIQFSITDTSKKRKITRFGTDFVEVFEENVAGGGAASANLIPPTWEKNQQKPFLLSKEVTKPEVSQIGQSILLFQQGKYIRKQGIAQLFASFFFIPILN